MTLTVSAVPAGPVPAGPPPGPSLPRLLSAPGPLDAAAHLARHGPLPYPADLVTEIRRSGLRGRGGASFPTATKMDAVRSSAARHRHRPVVVANGTESEPLSAKDRYLLGTRPHLVLDGVAASAAALGAARAVVCLKEGQPGLLEAVAAALAERRGDPVVPEVAVVPDRYVAGEETALLNWLAHRRALPTGHRRRPAERGLGRRPTLVDNVETLAHVALIARHGGSWWASVGAPEDPGTMLVTVAGAVRRPGVREIPRGTALAAVLAQAGAGPATGVLVGGYAGTWLSPGQAAAARLSVPGLAPFGAGPGCGAVAVLGDRSCPLAEVARVTAWLAGQSSGQCGPCVHGLDAIAGALTELATGAAPATAAADARRWAAMVEGRGGCRLPDGAVRFVCSALDTFADHVAGHEAHGPCPAVGAPPVLPVPSGSGAR